MPFVSTFLFLSPGTMELESENFVKAKRIVELYQLLDKFRDGLVEIDSISKSIYELQSQMNAQLEEEKLVLIGLRLLEKTGRKPED
jgi:hypothetical protein